MRAFTTFNVKLYPISRAEGAEEAVEKSHNSHFQEDGIQHFFLQRAPSRVQCVSDSHSERVRLP
jgi:hypothetical protein